MSAEKINSKNIGLILLAAGESSRLGTPKQLLLHDDRTLLQHSLQAASDSDARPVIVVLGANADTIKRGINGSNGHVIINTEWQEGMASSIRFGINALVRMSPFAEGTILMVCDQPYVSPTLLNNLITTHKETGKPVVACSYGNTFGPPVFFHKTMFPELLQLRGDVGAKGIIRQHVDDVELIPFPKGNMDIDTEADYKKLSKGNSE
ncbi:MAG: nucleotidyltransferase family protein [Chitinophagaceae bacterium]|nr:nucleotidyltransferase family protein [Chitinophagaceae bacterium]